MADEAEAQLAHLSGGHHVPDYSDFYSGSSGHPNGCGGMQSGCVACAHDTSATSDAETERFHAELGAAELADQLAKTIHAALVRGGHYACSLEPYATTTLHEGETVVLCGCGEFFPAPELAAPTVDLSPERVDAHGPEAVTVAAADPIARTLALIAPGQDYTPEQIEKLMLDTVYRLEQGQAFERWALEQAAEAERQYGRRYALEFTKATGAMELRRYTAEVACADLADAKDRTDMVHRAAKAAMHNLRSTLSGYQSVLKSVQATYQAGGSSGGRPF